MPSVIVNPDVCKPELCDRGRCLARKTCPTKAILQLDPGDPPQVDSSLCRGCTDCFIACPAKAIKFA